MFLDSTLAESLVRAYQAPDYVMLESSDAVEFVIRIGQPSSELDALLHNRGVSSSAVLTAWNPSSQPLSLQQNRLRQVQLVKDLHVAGWPTLPAARRDSSAQWPQEESALVLGIDRTACNAMARRFEQNAYVWCERGRAAELVLMH